MAGYYDGEFETPVLSDLDDYSVDVTPLDEPGDVKVVCRSNDGSQISVVWERLVRSVWVESRLGDDVRYVSERMGATKVSFREVGGAIEIRVWSRAPGFEGQLLIEVGESVSVKDSWLRA